jgi:aspartate kinase
VKKNIGEAMLVMKFGGASVASPHCFHKIAKIIATRLRHEKQPIVVVISAMTGVTDQLLGQAMQVHPNPPKRELDMLISVGERVSIALLAMALSLEGVEALSFTGSQSGIITDEQHADAHIVDVRPYRILPLLKEGKVAIVAGFQGVSRKGDITTLGRGGSDTSAVSLAAALMAERVDFYKDVDGIYEVDPKTSQTAKKIRALTYEQAKEIAKGGAKVLHLRSIELAEKNGIQLRVRSFDSPDVVGSVVGDLGRKEAVRFEDER